MLHCLDIEQEICIRFIVIFILGRHFVIRADRLALQLIDQVVNPTAVNLRAYTGGSRVGQQLGTCKVVDNCSGGDVLPALCKPGSDVSSVGMLHPEQAFGELALSTRDRRSSVVLHLVSRCCYDRCIRVLLLYIVLLTPLLMPHLLFLDTLYPLRPGRLFNGFINAMSAG